MNCVVVRVSSMNVFRRFGDTGFIPDVLFFRPSR